MENELMMFYLLPASPNSQKHKLKFLSQAIYDPPLRKINRNPEQALWMAKSSGVIWGLICIFLGDSPSGHLSFGP